MASSGRAEVERWMAWAAAALFLPLLAATAATIWILTEIRKEQRAVAELLRRDAVLNRELLGTLPGELRWQLVLTVLVLLVLVAAAVALWSMMRAYGGSQRMLREERLLSAEILASMEQGVITTDRETRIMTANPRAATLLEWRDNPQGSSLESLGDLEVRLATACREVLTRFEPIQDLDLTVDRRDVRLQLRADLHLLRGATGDVKGTVVHLRDVTDRVVADVALLVLHQIQRVQHRRDAVLRRVVRRKLFEVLAIAVGERKLAAFRQRHAHRPVMLVGAVRHRGMKAHRSTSPITTSSDPITAITSAIMPPTTNLCSAWQANKPGARMCTRHGRLVPSDTT